MKILQRWLDADEAFQRNPGSDTIVEYDAAREAARTFLAVLNRSDDCFILARITDAYDAEPPYPTGEVFLQPQDAAAYRDAMNEAHKEHLGGSRYIALSGKLYTDKAATAEAFAVLPEQMKQTVYTVLVNDGVEHVAGVYTDRERALTAANEELERMTKRNPLLAFAEDDAEMYVSNLVFSQSSTIGTASTLFGVIVQSHTVVE